MSSIRALYDSGAQLLASWASNEVVRPLLEPIAHPRAGASARWGLSTALHTANGTVRVASNLMQGASFTIELPLLG